MIDYHVVYWQEEDGEEMLWVCQCCDAHLNADYVGEKCPACDYEIGEDE